MPRGDDVPDRRRGREDESSFWRRATALRTRLRLRSSAQTFPDAEEVRNGRVLITKTMKELEAMADEDEPQ